MTASGRLRVAWIMAPVLAGFACERPDWQLSDTAPVAVAGARSFAGSAPVEPTCGIDGSVGPTPIMAPYTVLSTSPARPELYAYVSDAEAAELRRARRLVAGPTSVSSGAQSPVLQQLSRLLVNASSTERPLLESLQRQFSGARAVWPSLFPLRLVEHPGTEHMNPVRITLRSDAWVGRMYDGALSVVDVKNQLVTLTQAAAQPERIAAIYVTVMPSVAPEASCERGLRAMELGNEAMVETWELGTQALLQRLAREAASLTSLFDVARPCGAIERGGTTFQGFTVCNTWSTFSAVTEYTAYGWSLATPSEIYKPSPQNLVSLIDALDGDRFDVAPFAVEPAAVGGAGGSGGDSAGGAEAGLGGAP